MELISLLEEVVVIFGDVRKDSEEGKTGEKVKKNFFMDKIRMVATSHLHDNAHDESESDFSLVSILIFI